MTGSSATTYDLLRSKILNGDLAPGERLRAADLSARYKIGLTPIREALLRLASEGLVLNENNRGAWVRQISLAELHDLFSTRRELEATCLRMAMQNRTPEWEAEILRTLHLLSSAPVPGTADDRDGATRWEAFHRDFHFTLVSACASDWRLRFWNTLTDHSERYRRLRLAAGDAIGSLSRNIQVEHEAIAAAILKDDSDRAVKLMDDHLASTENVMKRLLTAMENKKG